MATVSVPAADVPPLVSDVGQLLGLLQSDGSNLDFDFDWFANAISEMEAIPSRRVQIMTLLRDLLGKPAADAPTDRSWYTLPEGGGTAPVYVVLPTDDSGSSETIGLGIFDNYKLGQVTVTAAAFAPLFTVPITEPIVVTGRANNPIEFTLTIALGQTVTAGGVSFDGIELECDVFFQDTVPTMSLTFTNMKPAGPQSTVSTLAALREASVTDWVNALLGVSSVTTWLNRNIGSSSITIGAALVAAGLLTETSGVYSFGTLDSLVGKTPLQIAEWLLGAVLKVLAANTSPIVPFAGGGLWIFGMPAPNSTATNYGLRVQVPDLDLSPASGPTILLQLGKLLSGDTDSSTWITRSDPAGVFPDPGISITFLSESGDATPVPSFMLKLDLVSLGVDVKGVNDKPLVDINGVTLGGIEPRFLFSFDLANPTQIPWGVGLQIDDVGIPLGNGLTGASANPIASTLLSSGSASDAAGSDKEAVNPKFSAAISRMFDPANPVKLGFQLQENGASTNQIWIPMQRSFGPLQCRRIGIQWPDPNPNYVLNFDFDGGVALGPLAIDLDDLSLGIPLQTPGQLNQYTLDLQGLGIAFDSPALTITGGFLKNTTTTPVEYDGAAMIQAAAWSIDAIGSYASLNGQPSMFIFAQLNAELGGPPFFFVTGLCAGFGYNRNLRIPAQNEVADFPLLAGIADPSKIGGAGATPLAALQALADWVKPAQGVNWIAAGVQFTSFELVQSNVVVTAIISKDFQLAILGLARIKLAQAGPQFAYAELELEIIVHPSAGFFGVSAQLSSNSYIITQDCHLTGGFAFWIWYGGTHAGDFVVTLGGYHPAFVKPEWYPDEPRLGFSWQISDNLTIQGDSYFALTPSCAMGGGALDVEFHLGDLRAWFTAHADFLFTWKPFYFIGDIGVSIGASYKLDLLFTSVTVSVELGADMEIWGPPTGGVVHVSWFIISFSVSFGADKKTPEGFQSWSDFTTLLPQSQAKQQQQQQEQQRSQKVRGPARFAVAEDAPATPPPPPPIIITTAISDGLVSTDNGAWLVRGDAMTFSVATAAPLTSAVLEGATPVTYTTPAPGNVLAVRPMGVASITSAMTITVTGPDGVVNLGNGWAYTPTLQGAPASLWGAPLAAGASPSTPSADTLPGCLFGISGLTPPTVIPTGPDPIPLSALSEFPIDQGQHWLPLSTTDTPVSRQPQPSATSLQQIAGTIGTTSVNTRAGIFAALATLGYDAGANGDTSDIAANVNLSYPDAPMIGAPWQVAA